jgi:lipopolysaccharide/colanic/teichoic acid biosynthesis glycosyltransferase
MPSVLPFDLFYVEHASIVLDAALILKTAAEVVFHGAV